MNIIRARIDSAVAGGNQLVIPIGASPEFPVYILGAQVEEALDSAPQTQPDSANIYLVGTDTSSAGFSIVNGWLKAGDLTFLGAIPISAPLRVVCDTYHTRAGCRINLNVMIGTETEAGLVKGTITAGAVPVFPYGRLRTFTYTGSADATTLAVVPTSGQMWRIVFMQGRHDDGTSRVLTWTYSSSDGNVITAVSASVASGVNHPLFGATPQNLMEPMATGFCYPTLSVPAISAGKKLSVDAIVYEMAHD